MESATAPRPDLPARPAVVPSGGDKGLKKNAIGLVSSVVIDPRLDPDKLLYTAERPVLVVPA